jgi:AcrR family transcriptional regulator
VPRRSQPPPVERPGRANQKRRTRAAIIAAAHAIHERGETPTIAQVAEEALMTRQTVYRYFPTQESLLLELSVSFDVAAVAAEVEDPGDRTPPEHVLDLVTALNRFCVANEGLYRVAQRHYLDLWLAAERRGEGHERPVREGRRAGWIATALAPVRDTVPEERQRMLEAALCLVLGGEAITVLADVCHLSGEEAVAVTRWAAEARLAAGLGPEG